MVPTSYDLPKPSRELEAAPDKPHSSAPTSLAHRANRTVAQEALMLHVTQLERQCKGLMKELRADASVDRIGLAHASAFLEFGVMALRRAVMREPWI